MKKASKILLIVGGALGIFLALLFLIIGIVFLTFTTPEAKELIIQGLNNGTVRSDLPGTPEQQALVIQSMFLGLGIGFIVAVPFYVVSSIFSFVANGKESANLFIVTMVFGILAGNTAAFLGGLFGLICQKSATQPQPLDLEA